MPIRITGMNSGLDTDSIVQELVSAYSLKTEKYEKEKTKLEWKQDAWKDINTKIYGLYTKVSNLRYSSAYSLKKTSVSDGTKATISAGANAVEGTQKLNVIEMAQAGYMTGGKITKADGAPTAATKLSELGISDTTIKVNGKEVELKADMKLSDLTETLKKEGLRANFDEGNGRLYISAKESGTEADFTIEASGDANSFAALQKLGLADTVDADGKVTNGPKKLAGKDAKILLNGVEYTSTTNNFSINDLSITVTGVTGADEKDAITVTTATDVQGIYDKIKDFLTEYNSVVNEMNKLYNAGSAKGYEPLTDEEKDAMSDTEIEKWENKIKDSILRRDGTLSGVMTAMTSAMSGSFEVNGKKMSLGSFGIQTMGFLNAAENEQYAYHIDGDPDDENTSGKTDKLMKAIQEDADSVCEFMKKLTSNLYDAVDKKMKSTSLSSAYKVYNDKEMDKEVDNIEDMIKKWEEKLKEQEDYYYKQFAAMETAMGKLNSQSTGFNNML